MNEFKIGDKVLVEVKIIGEDKRTGEYQVKPATNTWTFWTAEDEMHPLTAEDAKVSTKTYEDGLADAWKTARRISCDPDRIRIFDTFDLDHIFEDNTYQEAAAKIAEWEKQKIHVGDVVKITLCGPEGVASLPVIRRRVAKSRRFSG